MRVNLVVSDPWDFVTEIGAGPFTGKVTQIGPSPWAQGMGAGILRLDNSFTYQGVTCEYFIATPRYQSDSLQSLGTGSSILCNLTRIPEERAISLAPFDMSWWRGGIKLIGTLQI